MQYLKNDMEDLFKRAGENYSPQKGKSDWENIARQLADKSRSPRVVDPVINNRNKKIIAFFLLLFIVSVGVFMIRNTPAKLSLPADQNELLKRANSTVRKEEIEINNPEINKKKEVLDIPYAEKTGDKYSMKTRGSSVSASVKEISTVNPSSHFENNEKGFSKEEQLNDLGIEKTGKEEIYFFSLRNLTGSPIDSFSKISYNAENLQQNKDGETILNEDGNSFLAKKRKKASLGMLQKNNGIYFGLIAASDFSKVKSPSFHHTGFDAGLIAGYRINKKLSFETGVIWNKKAYSSEGKNFNMDKVSSAMPAGMIINDLESRSSLVEIPVNAKYDFFRKRNANFFIAGGVSSYIMTMEENMYNVTINGNREKVSGVYKKNNYGIPAVASFSFGFEQSISRIVNIRVEPFLKVPLRGMGVGSLPVTSAGLQIGFTSGLK